MLAPSVRHLDFVRDDGQPLDFIPGQFIQVHFTYPDGTATKRSYSLATIHDHALGPGEAVQIAVSYVAGGAATDPRSRAWTKASRSRRAVPSGASASAPPMPTGATC
jgi:ferredoxin-NADP reductase